MLLIKSALLALAIFCTVSVTCKENSLHEIVEYIGEEIVEVVKSFTGDKDDKNSTKEHKPSSEQDKHLSQNKTEHCVGHDSETEGEATAGSCSESKYIGWFKIKVLGTGKACYSKERTFGLSYEQEFGEFASTEAFVAFYGYPDCEVGDVGLAFGKIRAYVVAAAYEKGPDCLSRVISSVIEDPEHQFSIGTVSVRTSGESVGEALALCETEDDETTEVI